MMGKENNKKFKEFVEYLKGMTNGVRTHGAMVPDSVIEAFESCYNINMLLNSLVLRYDKEKQRKVYKKFKELCN